MLGFFENIQFVHPGFLFLLLLIPAAGAWYYLQQARHFPALRMPTLDSVKGVRSWRARLQFLLPLLRALAFAGFVIALARPQEVLKKQDIKAEGIDIFLVMDLSNSMLAKDFNPNRLEVSKQVALNFVEKRKFDRIGLAAFSGEAFTQCPLTTDHRVVKEFLRALDVNLFDVQGTAIGMGLATAVNRLKESAAKSKVAILLTDGVNNQGYIAPLTAAEIAKEFGIKVYTIGVGTNGLTQVPTSQIGTKDKREYIYTYARVEIDEELLQEIAAMTGGKYFRATTKQALEQIYQEIDRLEKTEMDVSTIRRYSEEFHRFAFVGLLLLLLEILLRYSVLRTLP